MQVLAFGINHNTASVEIRERLNFNQGTTAASVAAFMHASQYR